ncbi:MAG: type II toxin-antitoxin system HicB family antitoxin [Methanothrix sp.]
MKKAKSKAMITLHYKVLLRKEEDGIYTVIVPSLPGCLTFGHTVEEALEMAKKAIDGFIERMIARGDEVPVETDDAMICTVAVEAMVINDADIKQKINDSILLLIKNDSYLLKREVHERAIAHRLALYLEPKFSEWDVDCEYNRDYHDEPKKLPRYLLDEAERDETKEKTVIPDIIVHHRGPGDYHNLLAIEIKTTNNSTPDKDNFDYLKLMAFKSELKYKYSLFIKFNTGNHFKEDSININDNVTIEWDPVGKTNPHQ